MPYTHGSLVDVNVTGLLMWLCPRVCGNKKVIKNVLRQFILRVTKSEFYSFCAVQESSARRAILSPTTQNTVHKICQNRVISDLYFLYKERIYDHVLIRENMSQRKPVFWHILDCDSVNVWMKSRLVSQKSNQRKTKECEYFQYANLSSSNLTHYLLFLRVPFQG